MKSHRGCLHTEQLRSCLICLKASVARSSEATSPARLPRTPWHTETCKDPLGGNYHAGSSDTPSHLQASSSVSKSCSGAVNGGGICSGGRSTSSSAVHFTRSRIMLRTTPAMITPSRRGLRHSCRRRACGGGRSSVALTRRADPAACPHYGVPGYRGQRPSSTLD